MPLDEVYVSYLTSHSRGRLATVGPDGGPQNKPVGYSYNADLATIDIGGYALERSAKYRNVGRHPAVSFVIDDAAGGGAEGMRFLEIRGQAEQAAAGTGAEPGQESRLIRIHPRRMVSWNIDPNRPGLHTADIAADGAGAGSPEPGQPAVPSERPLLDLGDGAAWEAADAADRFAAELQAGFDASDASISDRHFAADVVWGSPFGATVYGYDELHAIHVRLKRVARGGAASRYEVLKVLAPAPGVAVAQIRRTALADGQPTGPTADLTGPFSETALYVLVRRGATWWLAAGQNTPVLPPPP
jgi:PPOX class F420-dependent enzyme/OxyR family protein